RIERHQTIDEGNAGRQVQAAKLDAVLVGIEPQIVAQVNGGNHEAELARDLLAQGRHPSGQLPAAFEIDERKQTLPPTSSPSVSRSTSEPSVSCLGPAAAAACASAAVGPGLGGCRRDMTNVKTASARNTSNGIPGRRPTPARTTDAFLSVRFCPK